MNCTLLTISCSLCVMTSTAVGQQSSEAAARVQLSPVFSDEFSSDTRPKYKIVGDVSWQSGALVLAEGASLERVINGGGWAKVTVQPKPVQLSRKRPRSEFRVWFLLEGATDCYVRVRYSFEGGRTTASAALIDTGQENGKPAEYLVREVALGQREPGQVTVEYRHGLALVALSGPRSATRRAVGHINNGSATVRALRWQAQTTDIGLATLVVTAHKATRPIQPKSGYTEGEKAQLEKAALAAGRMRRSYGQGKFADAIEAAQQVVSTRRLVLGEGHPDYAQSLNNLAMMYLSTGDYGRAEPLLRQASDIWRDALGEQHPEHAAGLNNLAGLYESMGDYAQSKVYCERASGIWKSALGEQHPHYAASLNNLAELYRKTGDYVRAEPLYKQALEIEQSVLGESHPSYAQSLNNLASLYEKTGDYDRSERLYVRTIKVLESTLGDQHPHYATSLNNLAYLYESMGDYARAKPLYERSRDIRKTALGEWHPSYATTLHNLAGVCYGMADHTRADALYRHALMIRRGHLNSNAPIQSARQQIRNQKVERFYLDNRLSNALSLTRGGAPTIASDIWQWKGAVTARQRAYRAVSRNPELAPLFAKLRRVTQRLSTVSGGIPIPPGRAASDMERESFTRGRQAWEQLFAGLVREREDLEQRIAGGSNEFRRIGEPLTPVTVQSVLTKATAFIDLLEYEHGSPSPDGKGNWNFESRYLAVVVRSDGPVSVVELGDAEKISDAVIQFRRPLAGPPDAARQADLAAQTLRESVWLPLEARLSGIETVIISPDTALGTLPFGALPGRAEGSYLIEEYKFVSLPLAGMFRSLLEEPTKSPPPEKGLLAVGDVDYDADSRVAGATQQDRATWVRGVAPRSGKLNWRSLPGFGAELAIVEREFRKKFGGEGMTTLDGTRATEVEFMKQAPRHYNLHLITHGYFADSEFQGIDIAAHDDAPGTPLQAGELAGNETINQYMPGLLSGIVLAGANNPPLADESSADGILTASEIEALDLHGVDLVVLSACETGLGKTAGGEGLTGLQRAFHIAGAKSVVATLWKVDDKATQEIMARFYRNYWGKQQSKIDALRNAQLDVLRNPRLTRGRPRKRETAPDDSPELRTDPRYWAAFQLSGDWR